MASSGQRLRFMIALAFAISVTSVTSATKFDDVYTKFYPPRTWLIRVHIHLPQWLTSPASAPSTWFVNKGICPPSLCTWNKRDKKMEPKNKLHTPFFQGDIVLDDAYSYLHTKYVPGAKIRRKRATSPNSRLWPRGRVPFLYHENFDAYTKTLVESAMRHIENKTCVRFEKKTPREKDYLVFISEPGCWSYIGKRGGAQEICLGEGCDYFGTALHEISHALGFWHEQSRHDRDEYVTIVEKNIISYYLDDFTMVPAKVAPDRGYAYDYGSIMHYKSHTYTRNTNVTIEVIGPGKELGLSIGQRDELSNLDIAQFDAMYRCNLRKDLAQSACPGGWVKYRRSCYKFVVSPALQFAAASRDCRAKKADLVRIESNGENRFLTRYLKINRTNRTELWRTAGRKIKKSNGTFAWYDSRKKRYLEMRLQRWSRGHPGSFTSHAFTWNESSQAYEWRGVWLGSRAQRPKYSYSYICEKPAKRKCIELKHRDGRDYRGDLRHTRSGVTCQMWSSQWPHGHNVTLGQDGIGHHNFCRNPADRHRARPWCYSTKRKSEWSYCDVTLCRNGQRY